MGSRIQRSRWVIRGVRGWRGFTVGLCSAMAVSLLSIAPAGAEEPDDAAPAQAFAGRPTPKGGMPTGAAGPAAVSSASKSAEEIRVALEEQMVAGRRPRIDLHIVFEYDSAELGDAGRRDLDEVGRALVEHFPDRRFELGGHTDASGPEDYNQSLSQARADAARQYLLEKFEIAPDRLEARGYGEAQPIPQADPQLNRRVVLELLR